MPTKKKTVKKAAAKKATVKKTAAKKTAVKRAAASKKTTVKKKAAGKKVSGSVVARRRIGEPVIHSTAVPGIDPYKEKKGEDYMGEAQVAHFNNLLQSWKMELMNEVDRTVHHMQDEAANFPDPNDRATQESEFSMELRARDRERKLIKKIDDSLYNLERDEYGYCESCGVEIGVRRLEARPTASLCIDCKTLDEIREKQQSA